MKTYFTFSQVSLEQVTSWFFKDAKDHQLPYYHNRKHFIITNSFKSGLDWRSNSEANKIRLLLSCFREKIIKHLKTSLLLGSPTLTEVHKMHVSFKEKKNKQNCIMFHNRRAQWGRDRTVTLENDLTIVMAFPWKSTDVQIWVMSTTIPIT